MRTENGKIENQTRMSGDLKLHGMWVGNCTVTGGEHLQLHGAVTGDLIVDEGSTASVLGMVSGNLTAIGRVDLAGMVMGLRNRRRFDGFPRCAHRALGTHLRSE